MPPLNRGVSQADLGAAQSRARQQAALEKSIAVRKAQAYDSAQTKTDLGLGNVDNTSDADKPVSTAQQTAIDGVAADLSSHEADTANPHSVTKSQVGLGNVDNTSDADKPVSTATQSALDAKMDNWIDPPASASDTGTPGQVAYDGSYFYVCVATDIWVRATLSTW